MLDILKRWVAFAVSPRRPLGAFGADTAAARIDLAEPAQTCAMDDVVRWHDWADACGIGEPRLAPGSMIGWRYRQGIYSRVEQYIPALAAFGSVQRLADWECDIQDVAGVSDSKAPLSKFYSLDAMIKQRWPALLDPLTATWVDQLLAHDQVRIVKPDSTAADYFAHYMWDGRVFMVNSGGSHHFAAARYVAARIGYPVRLRGPLYRRSIDADAAHRVLSEFAVYAIRDTPTIRDAFHEAMKAGGVTHFIRRLPRRAYADACAVFLPHEEVRSRWVANALGEAGLFDVGQHVASLCARQRAQGTAITTPADRQA